MLKKILKSYDFSLIIAIILLSLFGLVMVYSASMASAVQRYHVPSDYFYQKQKLYLCVSGLIFLLIALFPYKIMKSTRFLLPMVGLSILGLLGLFVFGQVRGNAQSWYDFGFISIQPAEFVKISLIIYLSAVYAKKQAYINKFNHGVLPPLAYLVIVLGLIAFQPDFGTALIIGLIAGTIILSSGMNIKNITKLILLGMILISPVFLVLQDEIFSEKRLERFEVLSNPFEDELDSGFHLANSYIAIGSGGINGLGLGKSVQKLGYLPESHTDFIMAVIAEELGVWGVSFVILTLGYIVLRGIYLGLRCKDPFGSLLAIGISSMIGIQSFINLAGVSGIMPLTGVPLPFVSYGGSSLLQLAIAAGILVNVSMFVKYENKYKQKHLEKNNNHQDGNVYQFRT
ncbi:FtsW/RodA/SpoVE family cell cycle protein [Neobacillus niacini]|uniref:FtsW/RodA/SpoVE family cell cycle protein n=1 Tax=Neobacillus niacini TaxID=86668 RepID=UPI0007ABF8B5|nr:FtsW/RodA/SpoVE family cell cycle protein [Neobacillus niacini]MEC1520994.1 FtsW/RodA/SpoVE family cell cycle protein [Neobacillus niacini]